MHLTHRTDLRARNDTTFARFRPSLVTHNAMRYHPS